MTTDKKEAAATGQHHRFRLVPVTFQIMLVGEEQRGVEVREPLPYRVYEEGGQVVQSGDIPPGQHTVEVKGYPNRRYAFWVAGEFATFHDEGGSPQ